MYGNFTNIRCV